MRVAYLTSVYPRATDTFIRIEVELLREAGFELKTYSVRRSPRDQQVSDDIAREAASTEVLLCPRAVLRAPVRVLRLAIRSPGRLARACRQLIAATPPSSTRWIRRIAYLVEAMELDRHLRAAKIDHLHDHIAEASATVAVVASTLSGVPFSMTVHGMELSRPQENALGLKIDASAFTVCVTQVGRTQAASACSSATDRIHVVRCGLGQEFLAEAPTPLPPEPTLVCVGRLSPEKGTLVLLEAAAILARQGVAFSLVLIGDGELREAVAERLLALNLGDHVKLAGYRSSREVRAALRNAQVLVVPSFHEGLPLAIIEALCLARPVVSTDVGGIAELVEPGRSGWLVPSGDPARLAEALREALSSPREVLTAMGLHGRQRVLAQHDAKVEVARLARLFSARTTCR